MPAVARVREVIRRIKGMECYLEMKGGINQEEFYSRTSDILKELKRAEEQLSIKKNSVVITKRQLECMQRDVQKIRGYVDSREGGRAVDDISYKITDLIHYSPEVNLDESKKEARYITPGTLSVSERCALGELKTGDKMKIVHIDKELDLNRIAVKMMNPTHCGLGQDFIVKHDGCVYKVEICVKRDAGARASYKTTSGC